MKSHGGFDLSTSEWAELIDEWIFSKRDREILKKWLIDDISSKKLQEDYNLSQKGIEAIIYKSEKIIFSKANKIKK